MSGEDSSAAFHPPSERRSRLLVTMCQFRPTPSNPLLNAIEMVVRMERARKKGARIIIFGETALQGYSIFDELKNPEFYRQSAEALDIVKFAADRLKIGVILGYYRQNVRQSEKWANNSLLCYIPDGIPNLSKFEYSQNKVLIPFEKELTENLYVQEGRVEDLQVVTFDGLRVGFNICQDSWQALSQIRRFKDNPVEQVTRQEPDVFINISSSPFYLGKTDDMIYNVLSKISRDHNLPVLYLGIVGLDGGQLVLGGYSQVLYEGQIYSHMKLFEEDEVLIDLKRLHELPRTKKPQEVFSTELGRKKRQFQSMNSAFHSVFHYLCLKHGITEHHVPIEESTHKSCFRDIDTIRDYLEMSKQDSKIYAKKGFVFHYDGSPTSLFLAHVVSISLPPDAEMCVVITDDSGVDKEQRDWLEREGFEIVDTSRGELFDAIDYLTHERQLLPLDSFSFTDYMLGRIPRLVFGLAPLGSLSDSLIYELLVDYDLMKFTRVSRQEVEDQVVVDTVLQEFLQKGKDFKSVLLKSFPIYFQYMSRYGRVSDIAQSFLDYLLSIHERYHNAMKHVSNRINSLTIIQLTWYSPNRYKYVNHSLSVSDWYIRQAFESIRPQLENW